MDNDGERSARDQRIRHADAAIGRAAGIPDSDTHESQVLQSQSTGKTPRERCIAISAQGIDAESL